jgi:hypothetical protein
VGCADSEKPSLEASSPPFAIAIFDVPLERTIDDSRLDGIWRATRSDSGSDVEVRLQFNRSTLVAGKRCISKHPSVGPVGTTRFSGVRVPIKRGVSPVPDRDLAAPVKLDVEVLEDALDRRYPESDCNVYVGPDSMFMQEYGNRISWLDGLRVWTLTKISNDSL